MKQFPDTPEYTGLNTPIGEEYEIGSLAVEGRIPAEVEGTFFRAVPDPAFPPFTEDGGAILSGDGMVSAVRFAGGRVGLAMRYVQTARHRAEATGSRATRLTATSWPGRASSIASWSVQRFIDTTRAGGAASAGAASSSARISARIRTARRGRRRTPAPGR